MTSANSMSISSGANNGLERRTHALRNWRAVVAAAMVRAKALAPYAVIELVLPGGSVMALLLWLYRRRKNGMRVGPGRPNSKLQVYLFNSLGRPIQSLSRLPYIIAFLASLVFGEEEGPGNELCGCNNHGNGSSLGAKGID